MKVTVRYEAFNARNESTSKTFDIEVGELALTIETDRRERAQQAGKPIEELSPVIHRTSLMSCEMPKRK